MILPLAHQTCTPAKSLLDEHFHITFPVTGFVCLMIEADEPCEE